MRTCVSILVAVIVLISCNQYQNNTAEVGDAALSKTETTQSPYTSYGYKISAQDAMQGKALVTTYANLKSGDTAVVKIEAPINAVCRSRGCWMRLNAGGEEVLVKFKDYGFFVPLDAEGDAVVQGKAFLEELGVNELRHLAKDAGKTEAEIAAITEPKHKLRFMAEGVLIKGK